MESDPRAALDALVTRNGESYAALSRMIGRNDAYLQQYVRRGTPRTLAESDRRALAAYFGVPESRLGGGETHSPVVAVRSLDVAAAAGAGGLMDEEGRGAQRQFDAALLRHLGVRPGDASVIRVTGDSMVPTLEHGDEILVDRGKRVPGRRGALFVLRLEGVLMVKRLAREGERIMIASDNPAFPPIRPQPVSAVEVIGRVAWLGRVPD